MHEQIGECCNSDQRRTHQNAGQSTHRDQQHHDSRAREAEDAGSDRDDEHGSQVQHERLAERIRDQRLDRAGGTCRVGTEEGQRAGADDHAGKGKRDGDGNSRKRDDYRVGSARLWAGMDEQSSHDRDGEHERNGPHIGHRRCPEQQPRTKPRLGVGEILKTHDVDEPEAEEDDSAEHRDVGCREQHEDRRDQQRDQDDEANDAVQPAAKHRLIKALKEEASEQCPGEGEEQLRGKDHGRQCAQRRREGREELPEIRCTCAVADTG